MLAAGWQAPRSGGWKGIVAGLRSQPTGCANATERPRFPSAGRVPVPARDASFVAFTVARNSCLPLILRTAPPPPAASRRVNLRCERKRPFIRRDSEERGCRRSSAGRPLRRLASRRLRRFGVRPTPSGRKCTKSSARVCRRGGPGASGLRLSSSTLLTCSPGEPLQMDRTEFNKVKGEERGV
ncbi:hypothetical protein SKAU_G00105030 [Synaphobranchus kaupii]|uniref:Uncharacterized protein n=1 Tax=Synaphobranchus kaupii TaxID=118154 RepID=A0A9Q1FZB6_SYNKA|nr:hypothetical protein SKAU_G00105030 [Synaphobranchus kaupii]